jgi:hypothetical protein
MVPLHQPLQRLDGGRLDKGKITGKGGVMDSHYPEQYTGGKLDSFQRSL